MGLEDQKNIRKVADMYRESSVYTVPKLSESPHKICAQKHIENRSAACRDMQAQFLLGYF